LAQATWLKTYSPLQRYGCVPIGKPFLITMPSGFAALADEDEEKKIRRKEEKLAKKKAEILEGMRAATASTGNSGNWADGEAEEEQEKKAEEDARKELENEADSDDSDKEEPVEPSAAAGGDSAAEKMNAKRNKMLSAGFAPAVRSPPAPVVQSNKKKEKKGPAPEDEEIDALLAKLEGDGESGEDQPKEMSKAAARRAKKKASASDNPDEGSKAPAEKAAATGETEDAAEEDTAPKSAEEVRAIMKVKADALKTKNAKKVSGAVATAAAEAKARDADKKKVAPKFAAGGGKQARVKSSQKYQGDVG